jgi:hypothetical protein
LAIAGRSQAYRQLLQGKGPQGYSHLLNAGSQKLPKLLLILSGYLDFKGASQHARA